MITVKSGGRIYIDGSKSNFYIYEFVAPEVWSKWGIRSLRYIQEAIIRGSQLLRTKSGLSITINNYRASGTYRDSGTRTLESYQRMYSNKTTGKAKYLKTYSMHKFCGAVDLKIGKLSSTEMAKILFENEKELMEIGIRRIENPDKTKGKNRDWLHIDTGSSGLDYIVKVNP